jgi:hypothetical protein
VGFFLTDQEMASRVIYGDGTIETFFQDFNEAASTKSSLRNTLWLRKSQKEAHWEMGGRG